MSQKAIIISADENNLSEAQADAQKSPTWIRPAWIDAFLKESKLHRGFALVALISILVQFIVFKMLYPYAGFINGDSYQYLRAAYWNLPVAQYMIGYPIFLRLFSVFTTSDTALVAFQYLFIHCSALFFLFTLFRFYKPGNFIQIVLYSFMVFNPLFLYMSNYVSSDALFLGLSLVWFSLLIWIIHQPSIKLILLHTLVLLFAFMVRNNALIYPFIAIIAFSISRDLTLRRKLAGIFVGFLAVGSFMVHTANKYKEFGGVWEYSPFGGWLLANNAMYAYRYVNSAERKPVPEKFRQLDNMIRARFDTTRDLRRFPGEGQEASTEYMWSHWSPLYLYRKSEFEHIDSLTGEFRHWVHMGPFYADYGLYIISHYPKQYVTYYLWPNFKKYYAPPLEFLDRYNSADDTVAEIAQVWFYFKTNKVKTAFNSPRVSTLNYYPILAGTMNVLFLAGLIGFLLLGGIRYNPLFSKGVLLAAIVWVTNLVFTVFSCSVALRFQAFPILMFSSFALLLIEFAVKTAIKQDSEARAMKVGLTP